MLSGILTPLLRQRVGDLAERWTAQARVVLLLDAPDSEAPGQAIEAKGLVEALIGGFSDSDGVVEDTIGHGMLFGVASFGRGVSLHHLLKALDLLMAMTLFTVESAVSEIVDSPSAGASVGTSAADGIRLARRLQRRGALLTLAATRGYMQAYAEALRDRLRHLRHDLRNPLGTIKSVLALMDDESVPLEARANPNFRGMATRNTRSLEELIADRLGDTAALLPTGADQNVSVRAIASTVRRELRGEAEQRGVAIIVEEGGAHGRLDAAGLELLLRDALQTILRECDSGDEVRVDFDQRPGHATIVLSCESGRRPIDDPRDLERLAALAGQIGADITAGERLLVSIPVRASNAPPLGERERSVPREPGGLGDGESRHDVRGPRESHHGQAGGL